MNLQPMNGDLDSYTNYEYIYEEKYEISMKIKGPREASLPLAVLLKV